MPSPPHLALTPGLLALLVALIAELFFVPESAHAENVTARMERVEGHVRMVRSGAATPLHRAAQVLRQDRILTGPGSRAAVLFPDGSRLLIGADAEAIVEDYLPEDGRQRAVILLDVPKGPVRLLLSKPRHGPAKQAMIRSRGTTVTPAPSQHIIDVWTGPMDGTTAVLAIVGRLSVRTEAGSLVLNKKRQGTFVAGPTASPDVPAVWPRARIDQALMAVE